MKKLMILMLVLGLASVTNAALVLSLNGSTDVDEITIQTTTNFTIDVYAPSDGVDMFWIGVKGPASYSGYGTLYAPSPDTMALDDGTYGAGYIRAYLTTPTITGVIGVWWDLELHCDATGDVTINLYNGGGSSIIDVATIHQIPEPMTIALLGLGGLFLRRRK